MSFLFNWLDLSMVDIQSSINAMLSATHIPQFPRSISIKSISLGENPPVFELLDIIELNDNKFKGLFKFNYHGELNVTLRSDMEINPLRLMDFDSFTRPHFVLSDKSTVLPVDFKLHDFKIDSLLTVVYNSDSITVVFKDEPTLDLNIETSIDELLDDEIFDIIKHDTIQMATEFLIQDLPSMIHKLKILDDYVNTDSSSIPVEDIPIHKPSIVRSESISTVSNEEITIKNFDMNIYNTLSLKPTGFIDIADRTTLSEGKYHQLEHQDNKNDLKYKKRRVIKLGSSTFSPKSSPKKEIKQQSENNFDTTNYHSLDLKPDDVISTSSKLEQMDNEISIHQQSVQETSSTSSPTLFNEMENSIIHDGDFETFVLSEHVEEDLNFNEHDPYGNLLHPMDILPSFNDISELNINSNINSTDASIELNVNEKLIRPRGPSSNYINLNSDFKKFSFQDFKTTTTECEVFE